MLDIEASTLARLSYLPHASGYDCLLQESLCPKARWPLAEVNYPLAPPSITMLTPSGRWEARNSADVYSCSQFSFCCLSGGEEDLPEQHQCLGCKVRNMANAVSQKVSVSCQDSVACVLFLQPLFGRKAPLASSKSLTLGVLAHPSAWPDYHAELWQPAWGIRTIMEAGEMHLLKEGYIRDYIGDYYTD